MEHLIDLFSLVELTRSQPQTGYILSGIPQDQLSNLAEHHYLVAFMAWQLASVLKAEGASIDLAKVLEFTLVHDLGELFGGDIAMSYAKANPKAKELAKAFETENQQFLSKFFGGQKDYYLALSQEIMHAKSDEALIAKIADYIECVHYKIYIKAFSQKDVELVAPRLALIVEKISDPTSKLLLTNFADKWAASIGSKGITEALYSEQNY